MKAFSLSRGFLLDTCTTSDADPLEFDISPKLQLGMTPKDVVSIPGKPDAQGQSG